MKVNFDTEYGKVVIENNVVAKIAGLTAVECFGIVGMAAMNKRDGLVKLLTRNSLAKGIQIETDEEELVINFHIIIAYGVSISAVAENLMQSVKYQVENITGFKVKKINIFVEGVRVID